MEAILPSMEAENKASRWKRAEMKTSGSFDII